MIDTDKYEGYSEDEWILVDDKYIVMNIKTGNVASFDTRYVKISQPDMNLILDAPLLLAEVKRWYKVRDYILEKASYPTVKKLHLKDLLNFMEEVIE